MRIHRTAKVVIGCLLVAAAAVGCKPKPKAITELQRKEAAHVVSEAEFAMTMNEWSRADGLLAKAVQVDPNNGMYWLSLGSTRVRLGNKSGAKQAYEGALKAFEVEAAADAAKRDPEPWLKQVQVLALLGRVEQARGLLDKTAKRFPEDRGVRSWIESKQFDRMIADPVFKQVAL